ncbi:hypothetical protein PMIN01_09823 [Paraphaeosphaeria minitans]|uniref:Uncharacterized protein n=1 Tax=Paraphaeosphaeria minitans TaxID=565426 RepID=A0A9P6GAN4_9PLEO|nr:hypothetical protein PMIN01_09823 [Paraphaeosphaeria minitans]
MKNRTRTARASPSARQPRAGDVALLMTLLPAAAQMVQVDHHSPNLAAAAVRPVWVDVGSTTQQTSNGDMTANGPHRLFHALLDSICGVFPTRLLPASQTTCSQTTCSLQPDAAAAAAGATACGCNETVRGCDEPQGVRDALSGRRSLRPGLRKSRRA